MFGKIKINNGGVTLIEILISIAVVSFVTTVIYLTLTSAVANMGESKQRTGAISIANEKMEIIRNLDYNKIGIVDGIISGSMLPVEQVVRNNFNYTVYIDVRYIDDPFDGTGLDDLINTDYKNVQVDVQWLNQGSLKSVQFISSFVPKGVETNSGGGTLALNTLTSGGEIVSNVNVNLRSIENNPSVNYSTTTDNVGSLLLQGVPSQTYRITLSKSGYENVRTYPGPPDSSFNPNDYDLFVNENNLNSKNFFIDLVSDLKIKATDIVDNSDVSGILVEIEGGREIGSNPVTYNFNDSDTTDSNGEINYSDISPGFYEIVNYNTLGNDNYDFVSSSTDTLFQLNPGENKTIELFFGNEDTPSVYVQIVDDVTSNPLPGAAIGLMNTTGFDQGGETREDGTFFFPLENDPPVLMENGEYTLEVRMNGYQDYSGIINVENLTTEEVRLSPL